MNADGKNGSRPVTDADRQKLRDLHAQGKGRNEIARDMGRSPATVSVLAQELGLSFDRTAAAAATEARRADLKQRRVDLVARLYGRAEAVMARLEAETFRTLVGSGPGVEEPTELPFVPPPDEKNLATSVGSYLTSAAKLEAIDGDVGSEAAKSLLGGLATALGLHQHTPADA